MYLISAILAAAGLTAACLWHAGVLRSGAGERAEIPLSEGQTFAFLEKNMSDPGFLIHTNFLEPSEENENLATGRDILSESQGLMLLYLANRDKKEAFDDCLAATSDCLLLENGTISWVKRADSEKEPVNALIDDLRILRAMMLAYEKWNDAKYKESYQKLSGALLAFNTRSGCPLDFYDLSRKEKSARITLSYLDLDTMSRLIRTDRGWEPVYQNAASILEGGRIGNTGLYAQSCDVVGKTYETPDEISLIQSVYVMLHLAEAGAPDEEGGRWLWGEYEKYGKIFALYTKDGRPATKVESTALYALSARLYEAYGQHDRAERLLSECERFRVKNEGSPIFGSFGEESKREVYSFDNLSYLLSSSIVCR